eukprot:16052878-Heterocapsa_arctica.AAC.1
MAELATDGPLQQARHGPPGPQLRLPHPLRSAPHRASKRRQERAVYQGKVRDASSKTDIQRPAAGK